MSKYNTNGLPWSHGIGREVTDCVTAKEVMQKAKLDWTVEKCELVAKMPFNINGNNTVDEKNGDFSFKGNIYRECPKAYGTYRTDVNLPLGIVKDKYKVVQNIDAFDFFDDAIGKDKAVWQRAGLFGVGQKVFVTAKLPTTMKVGNDEIENYLVFSNSHDGSSSINILFTPIRVICTNMLNSALKNTDSYIRIRHTESAEEKLQTGAEILRIAAEHANSAQELYRALQVINMSDDDIMKYILDLNLTEQERGLLAEYSDIKTAIKRLYNRDFTTMEHVGVSTRKMNTIVNMFEYYMDGIGQKEIAGTAWGAYNAVTGFYSNVANLSGEKRMDSLLYGSANRVMNKALNLALSEAV